MHTERTLPILDDHLQTRVSRLQYLLAASGSTYTAEIGRLYAYVVMEALNCWVLFARSFVISSALGARTRNSGRVTSVLGRQATVDDAIVRVTLAEKPYLARGGIPTTIDRRLEPAWHDPAVIIRSSSVLRLSNDATITAALSMNA